jgi:hypothetical protein
MNQLLVFTILLLIVGVLHTATTSIGINCSNENPAYKEKNSTNHTFLISQLVCGVLVIIIGLIGVYLAVTEKDIPSYQPH